MYVGSHPRREDSEHMTFGAPESATPNNARIPSIVVLGADALFAARHIALDMQPDVFDSVIPPDRRRHRSLPGGLPTAEMLWSAGANGGVSRSLVELYGDELPVELAQHLLAGKPTLIDVAPKLGCVCSGAAAEVEPAQARSRVAALEPPRAPRPVLDETVAIDAALPLPASPRSAIDIVAPP